MFPIYEISAAPHLPYALRDACEVRAPAYEIDTVETRTVLELLADGIVLAPVTANWN